MIQLLSNASGSALRTSLRLDLASKSKVINHLLEAGPGGVEGGLTNRKDAGMGHISKATAQRELADLVQKGILRTYPSGGRSTSYDLC